MENPFKEISTINPQREIGRREIANEIWKALALAGLSGGEYQLIMVIIDRTWGYSKQSATISLGYFEKTTRMTRSGLIKALKRLGQKRIILRQSNGVKTTEYLFNKHFDTWLVGQSSIPGFTSDGQQLVYGSILDWYTTVYQSSIPAFTRASKLAVPSTEMPKEIRKETLKETLKEIRGCSPPNQKQITFSASTPASSYLFEQTGRKRWKYQVQKEQFEKAEAEVGLARMKEAIDWALTSGISNIKSIITAARKERDGKGKGTVGPDSHRGSPNAPTPQQYRASLRRHGV